MKIALVRGAFLNQYEAQIYYPLIHKHHFIAFSSLYPIHDKLLFPVVKLASPMNLPFGPFQRLKMPILNRLFIDAHWLIGLEKKLKGFDIAHAADTFYHYTNQCLIAKKRGYVKAVVATVFENIPFNNEGIRGRKKFKREAIENVDHFIAISERSKAALMIEGCSEEKITVITQHIDTRRFVPGTQIKKDSRDITILFTGRLEFYKGVFEIIFAAKRLLTDKNLSGYRLRFLLVGQGGEESELRRLLKKMAITANVEIKSLPYNQMEKIYHKADIFVAPARATRTYQEQFCTALLEAQASGLPIVTAGSGGIPENVGDAAIMANPGDFHSVAEGLKRFILSPKLREEYGRRARKRAVEKFDIRLGAKKLEAIYERVLHDK